MSCGEYDEEQCRQGLCLHPDVVVAQDAASGKGREILTDPETSSRR